MRTAHLWPLFFAAAVACSAEVGPPAQREQPILNGTVTTLRPEVLWLDFGEGSACSSTLIGSHYVLTAAHCFHYTNDDPRSGIVSEGKFTSIGSALGFKDRIHIFAGDGYPNLTLVPDGVGYNDVALMRLQGDVPASVATPATLATAAPEPGDQVSMFGYGCTRRFSQDGVGTKRSIEFHYGDARNDGCQGDSGGPLFSGAANQDGALWGTATGWTDHDIYGSASYFSDPIMTLVADWDHSEFENGFTRSGPILSMVAVPSATAGPSCRDACRADPRCQAFTAAPDSQIGPSQQVCTLWAAVGPPQPCAGCVSGTQLAEEYGVDRMGSDYGNFELDEARPELCRAACARLPGHCFAYSYVAPGLQGPKAHCWLKNQVPAPTSDGNVVSGVNRSLEADIDRPGKTYQTYLFADAGSCKEQCARDGKCKAFTWSPPASAGLLGACEVKSAAPPPLFRAGAWSAIRRGLEMNVRRNGVVSRQMDQDTAVPELCQTLCAGATECQAWSYAPSGALGKKAHCFIYSTLAPVTSADGWVSGVRGEEFYPAGTRAPSCGSNPCGPDGLGGLCGTCPNGTSCYEPTHAFCDSIPACRGKSCGPDGQGGVCGACPDSDVCTAGGSCCAPHCDGKSCGDDGCGGSCGSCAAGQACSNGQCVCVPSCSGKVCGSNGCGGSCGSCGAGTTCSSSGRCVCTPQCDGRECGPDGCGGSCGKCASGWLCGIDGGCCPAGRCD